MNTIARTVATLALFGAGILSGMWIDHRSDRGPSASPEQAATVPSGARQPLYYRNPMGLPDVSPVPKKDNMGMDYIPVYADDLTDEASAGHGLLRIPPARVQKIGVRSEAAALGALDRALLAPGVIEADERTLGTVAPRFAGWIDTLHVAETGRTVRRGELLFTAYSPELLTAQQEYLIAHDAARSGSDGFGAQLLRTARARLLNAGFDAAQIGALERSGEPLATGGVHAPADGTVLAKTAVAGARFASGETLYSLADLRTVWVIANVHEHDLGELRRGQPARLRIDGFPGEVFAGSVDFVYPNLDQATRTARVRIALPNEELRLRPGMFGRVELQASGANERVLLVPDSALIDSGLRQLVLVEHAEGVFEPRVVVPGRRGAAHVEILSGLAAGERVVVRANFLLDAESNLRAALAGFSAAPADADGSDAEAGSHAHGHGGH